jgi:hypothetical protein
MAGEGFDSVCIIVNIYPTINNIDIKWLTGSGSEYGWDCETLDSLIDLKSWKKLPPVLSMVFDV